MIIDTLDNLSFYAQLNPLINRVMDFLLANDLYEMEDGKYPIVGDDLFLNLTTAKSKDPNEAVIETHRKMIDIQIPLSGAETYGYTPLCDLPEADYDNENDISKMPDILGQSYVTCLPGMFAIFFPQDGHAPCISTDPTIRKAIFKMKA